MDNMHGFLTVLAVIGTVSGIVLGWTAKTRTMKQDTASLARETATMLTDVDYIKRGVDEVRLDQKDQSRRYNELDQRVTRTEEEVKNAHRRINRIEGDGK